MRAFNSDFNPFSWPHKALAYLFFRDNYEARFTPEVTIKRAEKLFTALEGLEKSIKAMEASVTEHDNGIAEQKREYIKAKADIKSLAGSIGAMQGKIAGIDAKIATLKASLAQYQTAAGTPPDADFLYRLGSMDWWASGDLRFFDESGGPRLIEGTRLGTMVGADMRLGPNSGIGFGFGYNTSNMTQTDAFGGGTLKSHGLDLMARGYWGPNPNLLFDASLSYGYGSMKNTRPTFSDSFNTHTFTYGAGVNVAHDFSDLWRGEGRLGWTGTHTIREASVDTSGFAMGRMFSDTGVATLSGRLLRDFEAGNGFMFVDGALNMVTNETVAAFDTQKVDGEIGAGVQAGLGNGMSLSARAFVGALGRHERTEYGGSVKLEFAF